MQLFYIVAISFLKSKLSLLSSFEGRKLSSIRQLIWMPSARSACRSMKQLSTQQAKRAVITRLTKSIRPSMPFSKKYSTTRVSPMVKEQAEILQKQRRDWLPMNSREVSIRCSQYLAELQQSTPVRLVQEQTSVLTKSKMLAHALKTVVQKGAQAGQVPSGQHLRASRKKSMTLKKAFMNDPPTTEPKWYLSSLTKVRQRFDS